MSYSFTTDPIDAGSGEGVISEAIDKAVGRKADNDETHVVVEVAKRLVFSLFAALGPGVASYTVTIEGHLATKTTMANLWVGVDAVAYDE